MRHLICAFDDNSQLFFRDLPIVAVVLDPILAPRLRSHQIEGKTSATHHSFSSLLGIVGVKFMYECVMGLRKHEGQGCILADEM